MRRLFPMALALALSLVGIQGCQRDDDVDVDEGELEEAAENAVEETGEAVDDVGDAVGGAAEDVGDATEDAAEDVGDAAEKAVD